MRIIQVSSRVFDGDSITNCIINLSKILDDLEIDNYIAAGSAGDFNYKNDLVIFDKITDLDINDDDIIFYHLFSGTDINIQMERSESKKVLIYHNITPPEFFRDVDIDSMRIGLSGKMDVGYTNGNYLKAITLSQYSKNELIRYGWKAEDVSVIPLILSADKTIKSQAFDEKIIKKYDDGMTNILFVGRVIMNKKIEDLLMSFAYYHREINSDSRLIIVGPIYYKKYYYALLNIIEDYNVPNIFFTDMVTQEELNAYYSVADIYLSLSEHEGFCMPIIEAMERNIPVIAYASSAVPETMGGAGVLLYDKTDIAVSKAIDKIIIDEGYRKKVIKGQLKRIESIYLSNNKERISDIISELNAIHYYKYAFEKETMRISKYYREDHKNDICEMISRFSKEKPVKVIIYGAGKIGRKLLMKLSGHKDIYIEALCDNYIPEKEIQGIAVMNHEQCISSFPNALFIISVQNNYFGIAKSLMKDGINENNIAYYDNKNRKIVLT